MKRTERFADLGAVQAERLRLKAERDRRAAAVADHWSLLHEPEFRHGLARDAASDLFRAWKPARTLGALLGTDNRLVDGALGMVAGAGATTMTGRAGRWLLANVLRFGLRRFGDPDRMERISDELGESWRRVKTYWRHRRERTTV